MEACDRTLAFQRPAPRWLVLFRWAELSSKAPELLHIAIYGAAVVVLWGMTIEYAT